VIYTHANDGSERWHQWRYENLRANGAGAQTVLLAGGKTWRPQQGYRVFTTTDGLAFASNGYLGAGGGASSVLKGLDASNPDDEWAYTTQYPGSSNGTDSRLNRSRRSGVDLGDFAGGPGYNLQARTEVGYRGLFVSDADSDARLAYVVSYSTPSWNSKSVNGGNYDAGWLAVHDHLGRYLAGRKLEVLENQELVGDPNGAAVTSQFHGTLGSVTVGVLPGMAPGTAEVLWYSGIYGYGRYLLGPGSEPPALGIARKGAQVEITFEGTLQSASDVSGAYADVPGAKSPHAVDPVAPGAFYRARD
jgi:hypothetical protein